MLNAKIMHYNMDFDRECLLVFCRFQLEVARHASREIILTCLNCQSKYFGHHPQRSAFGVKACSASEVTKLPLKFVLCALD